MCCTVSSTRIASRSCLWVLIRALRATQFTVTRGGPDAAAVAALRAVLTASAEELEARGAAAFSAPGSPEQEALVYQVSAAYVSAAHSVDVCCCWQRS